MSLRSDEVSFGEEQELRIIRRWIRAKQGRSRTTGPRIIKSKAYQDWDFLLLDSAGMPVSYIEIKARRKPFKRFGDCICPVRKHHFAKDLFDRHAIGFLMVVEYPDCLVQVDLAAEPDEIRYLERRDRPGQGQDHAYYKRPSIQVVD